MKRPQPVTRATVPIFLEPVNYEFRACIALMFGMMYCLPIVAGVVAILTGRQVLRAAVPISRTARIASIVSIVLGSGNILIWSINVGIRLWYRYTGHTV